MTAAFSDKSAKVLLVEPSAGVRSLFSDALKAAGFTAAQQVVAAPQDALAVMEVDPVDWIIMTGAYPSETVNALQILRLCSSYTQLHNVRVSLFLDDSEQWIVPKAFEMGALSWHPKSVTKEAVDEAVRTLMGTLEKHNWNSCLTAAEYLRGFLKTQNKFDALLNLERGVMNLFPGNPKQMVRLGEALAHSNNKADAAAILAQAKALNDDLADEVNTILKDQVGEEVAPEGGPKANVLGLKSVVIVDSDDAVRRTIEDILRDLGVESVEAYSDGESAWSKMKEGEEPSLIVQEWRIPKVSGPVLVQRVRAKGFLSVPIVVASSLIKPEDTPFVREMSVASVQQKPFNRQEFLQTVASTIQEDRTPTDMRSMERQFRKAVALRKMEEAEKLRATFKSKPNIPQGRKDQMDAEFAFARGSFEEARDFAMSALKTTKEAIFPLNLLGKVFVKLGDFEAALRCYEKAHAMAPQNLERLCAMAEAELAAGDVKASEKTVESATDIDPDAVAVQEATAKVATATGDVKKARKLLANLESMDNFISFMNNRAVTLTRMGQFEEGKKLYLQAIESLPEKRKRESAILHYNLGLACARAGDLDDAKAELDRSVTVGDVRLQTKAKSLLERITRALKEGTDLTLKTTDGEEKAGAAPKAAKPAETPAAKPMDEEKEAKREATMAMVEAAPGTLCCFMVFKVAGKPDEKTAKMLGKPIRFARREAIKRDETLGAERMMQQKKKS